MLIRGNTVIEMYMNMENQLHKFFFVQNTNKCKFFTCLFIGQLETVFVLRTRLSESSLPLNVNKSVVMCSSLEKCDVYPAMTSAIIATFITLTCPIVKRTSPSPTGNMFISPTTSPRITSTSARSLLWCTKTTATSKPTPMLSTLSPLMISETSFPPTTRRWIVSICVEAAAAAAATYNTIKKWSVVLLQITPINLSYCDQTTIAVFRNEVYFFIFWGLIIAWILLMKSLWGQVSFRVRFDSLFSVSI